MLVVLAPGETITVELTDTDGSFEISYSETELTVTSDLPGSHKGDAGVIYREVFAGCTCEYNPGSGYRVTDQSCPTHGEFAPKAIVVDNHYGE